jgi:hypothetical protein
MVRRFAEKYERADKAVLDIGLGPYYLQDVVNNYIGLDISPSLTPRYQRGLIFQARRWR